MTQLSSINSLGLYSIHIGLSNHQNKISGQVLVIIKINLQPQICAPHLHSFQGSNFCGLGNHKNNIQPQTCGE